MSYDVFFISHSETNAETNYEQLTRLVPPNRLRRVHRAGDVIESHVIAASQAETDFFFTVDGDNFITDPSVFDFKPAGQLSSAHLWAMVNPALGLNSSYGAVKLFPTQRFKDLYSPLTTQLVQETQLLDPFGVQLKLPSVYHADWVVGSTVFFGTPWEAFGSAFREVVKQHFYMTVIDRDYREKGEAWIKRWKNPMPLCKNSANLELGASLGYQYGRHCRVFRHFMKANDYDWLRELYNEVTYWVEPK